MFQSEFEEPRGAPRARVYVYSSRGQIHPSSAFSEQRLLYMSSTHWIDPQRIGLIPNWMRVIFLLSPPIQMLIYSGNIFTDTPKSNVFFLPAL